MSPAKCCLSNRSGKSKKLHLEVQYMRQIIFYSYIVALGLFGMPVPHSSFGVGSICQNVKTCLIIFDTITVNIYILQT